MRRNINLNHPIYYHPEKAELDLNNQCLTDEDIREVVLPFLNEHAEIKILNLSFNDVGNAGATALAKNHTLTSLNIRNNWIGDKGAAALATNQTLLYLEAHYNSFGDRGVFSLAANTTLLKLKLSADCLSTEGTKALAGLAWNTHCLIEVTGKLNGGLTKQEIAEVKETLAVVSRLSRQKARFNSAMSFWKEKDTNESTLQSPKIAICDIPSENVTKIFSFWKQLDGKPTGPLAAAEFIPKKSVN